MYGDPFPRTKLDDSWWSFEYPKLTTTSVAYTTYANVRSYGVGVHTYDPPPLLRCRAALRRGFVDVALASTPRGPATLRDRRPVRRAHPWASRARLAR